MRDAVAPDRGSVDADRVAMLYAGTHFSVLVTAAVATLFLGVHSAHLAPRLVLPWILALAAILLLRSAMAWRYNRQPSLEAVRHWVAYHRAGTLVTGVLWGWAGVLFFPEQQVHFQIFTVLVISGLAAGALTVHAPDFTSYLYYAIPSLLPVGGISLLQGDTLHVSIGVLVFAQMLFLLRTGHRLNESVLGSLRLRYENQGLVRDLQREKNRLDTRLARVLDGSASEVYLFDAQTLTCRLANGGALENLGLEGDDCGRFTLIELIDGIDRAEFERLVRPLREGEVAGLSLQVRHRRRDGTTYPVEARLQYSEREEPPVFVLTALDLTDREAAQEQVCKQQALMRSVIASAPIAIWSLDPQGRITFIDGSRSGIRGELPVAEVGDNFFSVFRDTAPVVADGHRALSGEGFVSTLDIGASRYEMHYSPLLDGDGHLNGTIGVAIDNTERKEYEDRLIRQANFDDLTGLPNRNYMLPRLGDAFARARRQRNQVALLFLDLDNFKTINDTLGHRAGDELLVLASERMRATLRESDTMFRMSGDEFLVCLEGIGAIREVEV
ncbi:MAG: hypothetical protein B0D87_08035, partial [Candidatus Sedimenticola endophacoides]